MRRLVPNTLARWLAVTLLVLVVVVGGIQVGGIQVGNLPGYVSEAIARMGESGYGPDASLTDLNSIDQLQSAFNHDVGHPRLLLLLSPT
jgi:hypothetical protein